MKKSNIIAIAILLISASVAMAGAPKTKMTVQVIDAETDTPISNALVGTRFKVEGGWNKATKYSEQKERTDAQGLCVLSGEDYSLDHGGGVSVDDYYKSSFHLPYTGRNRLLNRWEPWNPTIEVKMRPMKNPVPMVHNYIEWKLAIPKYNTPIGLDLEKGDWVQPHGDGIVSDMMIEIIPLDPVEKGSRCRITFSSPDDGIQEHKFQWESSSFKWPYLAPTNGYINTLERNYVLNFPKIAAAPEHSMKEDVKYIIRTRTQVDDDGNIISACYGYFPGEIRFIPKGEFKFTYFFNPVPNERSLEYSGENLLKKKDG